MVNGQVVRRSGCGYLVAKATRGYGEMLRDYSKDG
jgi:hypothetical protein